MFAQVHVMFQTADEAKHFIFQFILQFVLNGDLVVHNVISCLSKIFPSPLDVLSCPPDVFSCLPESLDNFGMA